MNASPASPQTPAPDTRTSTPVPEPGPRLPAWARIIIPIVLFLPIAMTGTLPMLIPGFSSLAERQDDMAVLAFSVVAAVTLAAYVLVSWALVRWIDRRPFSALGLRFHPGAVLGLLVGTVIAVVLAIAAAWLSETLGIARTYPDAGAGQNGELTVLGIIIFIVLRSFVLQGIGEEVLFRGYLMQSLRSRPVLAILITAIAFTIPHLASSGGQENALERVLYLAVAFGFSISAGFLAVAFRSVWAAAGIHGGFHVGVAVGGALGFTADGPGAWLTVGALHVIVGVVIALMIPRRRWAEVRELGPYGVR